jgi:glycosyltransferase involved in cell wall biosynthesis
MPVRNALPYLDAAVESVLGQTHNNFEFVIRDDDSTDGSRERLQYWALKDARIRLFEGKSCLGPANSSNWVVTQARSNYVARMDADDVSHPHRFAREIDILVNRISRLYDPPGSPPPSRTVRSCFGARCSKWLEGIGPSVIFGKILTSIFVWLVKDAYWSLPNPFISIVFPKRARV